MTRSLIVLVALCLLSAAPTWSQRAAEVSSRDDGFLSVSTSIGATSDIARISNHDARFHLVAHVAVFQSTSGLQRRVIIHQRVDGAARARFQTVSSEHGPVSFQTTDPTTDRCLIQHCSFRYLGTVHLGDDAFEAALRFGLPLQLAGESGMLRVRVPRSQFIQVMNGLPMF